MKRLVLLLPLCLLAISCGSAPSPTDVTFEIVPASTCTGIYRDPIRSVRVSVIGARSGVECIEVFDCIALTGDVRRIRDVEPQLRGKLEWDLLASRGYQFEAIGFRTTDCSVGTDFRNLQFCGQSDVVRFDQDQNVEIVAKCGNFDVPDCAGVNASLRPCR